MRNPMDNPHRHTYSGGTVNREFTITIGIDLEDDNGEWSAYMVENEIFEMFRVNPYMDAGYVRVVEDQA